MSKSTSYYGKFPSQTPFFQQRLISDEENNTLTMLLDKFRIVSLVGPLGNGKTTEALNFVENARTEENKRWDLIIWIDCLNFSESISAVEKELKISDWSFYSYLEKLQNQNKWLLILDNATKDKVRSLPNPGINGQIVITSTQDCWTGKVLHIPRFSIKDSQKVFSNISHIPLNDDVKLLTQITQISELMDYYPGAIVGIANTIRSEHQEVFGFLKNVSIQYYSFYPQDLRLLSEELYSSFIESLNTLKTSLFLEQKIAYNLLQFLVHLENVYIPREFFRKLTETLPDIAKKDRDKFSKQAIEVLIQYGFLENISGKNNRYLIPSPLLFTLRVYFSNSFNEATYKYYLWKLLPILTSELKEHAKQSDTDLQFYYMHSKALIERMLSLEIQPYLNSVIETTEITNFRSLIEKKKDTEILKAFSNGYESSKYKKLTNLLKDQPFISIADQDVKSNIFIFSKFLLSYINDLIAYDELDSALFYANILKGIIEKGFSIPQNITEHPPNLDSINWTENSENHFTLYYEALFTKGFIDALQAFDHNADMEYQALNLLNNASYFLDQLISKLTLFWGEAIEKNKRDDKNKWVLMAVKLQRVWIYCYLRRLPFDQKILDFQYLNYSSLDTDENNEFTNFTLTALPTIENLTPDAQVERSLQKTLSQPLILNLRNLDPSDKFTIVRYYYLSQALHAHHATKQYRYSYYRYIELKKLTHGKELLYRLMLDVRDNHNVFSEGQDPIYEPYELKKVLNLLYSNNPSSSKDLINQFNKIRDKLILENKIINIKTIQKDKELLDFSQKIIHKISLIPKTRPPHGDNDTNDHGYDLCLISELTDFLPKRNILYVKIKKTHLKYRVMSPLNEDIQDKILLSQLTRDPAPQSMTKEQLKVLLPAILRETSKRSHTHLPFSKAIMHLKNLYDIINKFFNMGSEKQQNINYIINIYRKLGKYHLKQYRALCENFDKKSRRTYVLDQAMKYYQKALDETIEFNKRDNPIVTTASIFLGLLECAYSYKQKEKTLSNSSLDDQDVLVDYFLRCRFILSHLYNNTYHFSRKLFELARNLKLIDHMENYSNIFDVLIMPSFKHLQAQLDKADSELEKSPNDVWRRYVRAHAKLNIGMYQEAMEEFQQVLAIYRYSSTMMILIGYAEEKLGDFTSALIHYAKAQAWNGNYDSLLEKRRSDAIQAFILERQNIKRTIGIGTKEESFITTVITQFSALLQGEIEKSLGQDERPDSVQKTAQIIQSVSKLIPKSLAAIGFSADIPFGDAIADIAHYASEIHRLETKYKSDKLTRIKINPEDINDLEDLKIVVNKLLAIFKYLIPKLTQDGVIEFSNYIAGSMLDYLGSSRAIPFLSLQEKLLRGALEGKYQLSHTVQSENGESWKTHKILTKAYIRTPTINETVSLLFKPPEHRSKSIVSWFKPSKNKFPYLERAIEDARRLGYEDKGPAP